MRNVNANSSVVKEVDISAFILTMRNVNIAATIPAATQTAGFYLNYEECK